MDKKDKKILHELSHNSRIPLTQLAKKTRISREVINYRLKKLEEKIIKKYSSQINIEAIGFQKTGCCLILQNTSTKDEKEIIKFLKKHKYISAISTNIGIYDIAFDIYYKNNNQLKNTIIEIENQLINKIKEIFFISMPAKQNIFYNKLFEQKKDIIKTKTNKPKKIDEIDLQIMKILNNNSRESLMNISKKTKLKANAIGYRIKELEKHNIITNSTIFVNLEELGFELYNIQIKINNNQNHNKIIQFLEKNPTVFYYYQYLGNKEWDIDIGAIIKNKKELKKLLQELKEYFG